MTENFPTKKEMIRFPSRRLRVLEQFTPAVDETSFAINMLASLPVVADEDGMLHLKEEIAQYEAGHLKKLFTAAKADMPKALEDKADTDLYHVQNTKIVDLALAILHNHGTPAWEIENLRYGFGLAPQ